MFERLKRLYQEGRLDAAGLERAVSLGWITQEQMREITEGADADTPTAGEA